MPNIFADLDFVRIGASVGLVALAALMSYWQKAGLGKDLAMATVRSFVQLIAIGYALEFIFNQESLWWTLLIITVMLTVAAYTSAGRAKGIPNALLITNASIGIGALLTIGLLVGLGIFELRAQFIIPIAGMVIGNTMTTCSLVMARLRDDVRDQRNQIETALALGATSRQAVQPTVRRAIRAAMVPVIDTTKTVGLIKLPGAMTGMILAGASPLEAVQLQIIVMYMLTGATAFTALAAAFLTAQVFFTNVHQLTLPAGTPGAD
ncbi:MAG: iron export ABC transporter permease subunit FetB [Caldilineaceae bacterium]|nr:iron export ABC transporter permease subunit FetB [Caldilineaceae bacterium]